MNNHNRTIDMRGQNDAAIHNLLDLGKVQDTRPTTKLCCTLQSKNGAQWIAHALSHDFDGNPVNAARVLCSSDGDILYIRRQYALAKDAFHTADEDSRKLRGLLWYLLLMAAAATHHDCRLSSQSTPTLTEALLEVAPDLPDPWGNLLAHGAMCME